MTISKKAANEWKQHSEVKKNNKTFFGNNITNFNFFQKKNSQHFVAMGNVYDLLLLEFGISGCGGRNKKSRVVANRGGRVVVAATLTSRSALFSSSQHGYARNNIVDTMGVLRANLNETYNQDTDVVCDKLVILVHIQIKVNLHRRRSQPIISSSKVRFTSKFCDCTSIYSRFIE